VLIRKDHVLSDTDAELVTRAREGDNEAFGVLVGRYCDAAYGVALHVLSRPEEAADAAQEALIKAYQKLDQLRDPARFSSWLCRIALNVARNRLDATHRCRERTAPDDFAETPGPSTPPVQSADCREKAEFIRQIMDKLTGEQRLTFTLYYVNGYSERDVSAMLDIPVGTVKSRLNHARAKLKEEVVNMAEKVLKESKPEAAFWRSATGGATGKVTAAATGQPIAGARVRLYGPETMTFGNAISGPDGTWEMTSLVPDAYSINVSHPDFIAEGGHRGIAEGPVRTSVVIRPGHTVRDIDFSLSPGHRLAGHVLSADGAPVAGVEVTLWRKRPARMVLEVAEEYMIIVRGKTDERGAFEFHSLKEGTYYLGAQIVAAGDWAGARPICYYPGTLSLHDAEPIQIPVQPASKNITIPFTNQGTTRLRVIVTDAVSGSAIPSAHILLNRGDAVWDMFAGVTGAEGCFETSLATPGLWLATAGAPEQGYARWSEWVSVASGQGSAEVRLALPKGAIITGRVVAPGGASLPSLEYMWCEATPHFEPRPKMWYSLSRMEKGLGVCRWLLIARGPQPEMAGLDEKGGIRFAPVAPGRVRIQAEVNNKDWRVCGLSLADRELHREESVEVGAGDRIDSLLVRLGTNLGVVAGRVVAAADQSPLADMWVQLRRDDDQPFLALPVETDRTGSFLFQSVPAGSYVIGAARAMYAETEEASRRRINLSPGEVVNLDVLMPG
jgi:RNA polymerase sigma-70 factor, ECF subfamily